MRFPALLASLTLVSTLRAQPGALDPTYGNDGLVILQPGSFHDNGLDIVVAPDTTSYVVSQVTYQDTLASAVTHLLANGQVDTAFGDDGHSYIHGGTEFHATAIARAADGSLFVTGHAGAPGGTRQVLLVKLLADGTPDLAFGTNGKVLLTIGINDDHGADLAIDANGRIVVVGTSRDPNNWYNSIILRFNAEGALDNTFSDDGKLFLTALTYHDGLVAVALAADGTVFGAGNVLDVDGYNTLLVKVDPFGQWDPDFGAGGHRVVSFSTGADMARGMAWDGDHLYACGDAQADTADTDGYIARFAADGSTDSTFNGTGRLIIDLNEDDVLNDVMVQPDGRVLACGSSGVNGTLTSTSVLIVRTRPDGTLDTDLDYDGIATTLIGNNGAGAQAIAQQADEKILITGFNWTADVDLLVARYMGGSCDLNPAITPSELTLCPGASDSLETNTPGQYQWYANDQAIDGATEPFLVVDGDDAGLWFTVAVSDSGCAATSDSVMVDSYLFLLPSIINAGDAPNLIGDNGEQIYCQGDDPVLVLSSPYDTNVQWSVNGEPIPGANDTMYAVPGSGSYTVEGAPALCPDFIQNAGVEVVMDFHPYIQPTVQDTGILLCPEPLGLSAQWFYNGIPVAGLDQCVIPIDAGSYTVFVDYGDSCSVLSAPFQVVGVAERAKPGMKASPVPTRDLVTITWTGGGQIADWRVLDVTGRIVRRGMKASSPMALDLADLDVGRYFFVAADGRSLPVVVLR